MKRIIASITLALSLVACAQPVTPTRFYDAVVECSTDIAQDPSVVANVKACLAGVVAGGYVQCLDLLPYVVEDIVCVVTELSRAKAQAINNGTANPEDAVILQNANAWLRANRISVK